MMLCEKNKCMGCGVCFCVCPVQAIEMVEDGRGWIYPKVNIDKCIFCEKCSESCPINQKSINSESIPRVFGMKAKSDLHLLSSSSGVGYQLMKNIIDEEGVVFGPVYDSEMSLKHVGIYTRDELQYLRKSKYVQSDITESFFEVEKDLKNGKKVMFTGCPCQVAALRSYLGKEYENLFLVDLVCMGVPNNRLLKLWKEELETKYRKKISYIEMRYKDGSSTNSWKTQSCKIEFSTGESVVIPFYENDYLKAFNKKLSVRESCFQCEFKMLNTGADITLGDFWGVEKFNADFSGEIGVSLIFLTSEKGEALFQNIFDKFDSFEITMHEILPYCSINGSHKKNLNYDIFWNNIHNKLSLKENIMICDETMSQRKKIGLFGSYNSRVGINETHHELVFQYSNSGLISLMAPKCSMPENINRDDIFRYNMCRADFEKSFLNNILDMYQNIDYLVIDLLEERFMVCGYQNSYITYSDAYERIGLGRSKCVKKADDYLIKWKCACEKFIAVLEKNKLLNKVIFIKQELNEYYGRTGKKYLFEDDSIININDMLRECNEFFIEKSKCKNIVEIDEKYRFTQLYHRYGCYPYHLNYQAYRQIGVRIDEIIKNEIE